MVELHNVEGIILSDEFKKVLLMATEKYEEQLIETGIGVGPLTIIHHQNINEASISYPYMLWDPLSQYKSLLQDKPITCPLCTKDGFPNCFLFRHGQWYNGRLQRYNPRVLYGTNTCTLLVSCSYKCSRDHEIAACHADILDFLKRKINVPFFLTHKNGFTLELAFLVEDLVDRGMTFEQVENLLEQQYKTTYNYMEMAFWRGLQFKSPDCSSGTFSFHNKFCNDYFPCPGRKILIEIFLAHFFLNENTYVDAMSSLSAITISCDHTFKSVCNIGYQRSEDGNWVTQYNSIFCSLNQKGEIVDWQFTKSEGFEEVRSMFENLKERFGSLELICLDNCCKWKNLLGEVFPDVPVKLDLFHAVQRFVKTLKKRDPVQRAAASDFGMIFRDPQDMGDTRKMSTPANDVLLSNLDNFLKKWSDRKSNGVEILNKERLDAINNIRNHVIKGCLSHIPARCSTSINERLHKDMKKLLANNRMGTELAYAKFTRFFFRHNQLRGDCNTIHSLSAKKEQQVFENTPNAILTKRYIFGLKPKEREIAGIPLPKPQHETYSLDNITPSILEEIVATIRSKSHELKGADIHSIDHTYSGKISNEWDKYVDVLEYALSIYNVVMTMKTLWSSKAQNLLKIPFIVQNCKTFFSSQKRGGISSAFSMQTVETVGEVDRLQNLASSFGFSIIPVLGDGNCFFRAVAFQILQILALPSCPPLVREHFLSLGIHQNANEEQLSSILRELIVNEWRENDQEYLAFFGDMDIQAESQRFLINGEFAGSLGDAFPLAMANVLNLPLYILTSAHNNLFLSVVPRSNVNSNIAIYLSYNQNGPGHYDILVSKSQPEVADVDAEAANCAPLPAGQYL